MTLDMNYELGVAIVSGAIHDDGQEFNKKGIRAALQKQAKKDGFYGLEFWDASYKMDGVPVEPGDFYFEIMRTITIPTSKTLMEEL